MFYLIGIAIVIFTFAIAIDIILNNGDAISTILENLRSNNNSSIGQKAYLIHINQLKEELDELNDELTYDNSENEIQTIKAKITLRENIIRELLYKNKPWI